MNLNPQFRLYLIRDAFQKFYEDMVGQIIALILYVWFVSVIVEDGRKLKLENSGKMYNFYLGKYLGFALEWFTPIMLFFVY